MEDSPGAHAPAHNNSSRSSSHGARQRKTARGLTPPARSRTSSSSSRGTGRETRYAAAPPTRRTSLWAVRRLGAHAPAFSCLSRAGVWPLDQQAEAENKVWELATWEDDGCRPCIASGKNRNYSAIPEEARYRRIPRPMDGERMMVASPALPQGRTRTILPFLRKPGTRG